MSKEFQLSIYNRWSWEEAFGCLPRYRVNHASLEEAEAEGRKLARRLAGRGDGRALVLVTQHGDWVRAVAKI